MQFLLLGLLILVLVASTASTQQVEIRYVRPNISSPLVCPGQPCLTLDQYTHQTSVYFTSLSTFVFLAGNHTVSNAIKIRNISGIPLTGETDSDVNILMWHSNGVFIRCVNVIKIKIVDLKFELCFKKLIYKQVSILNFSLSTVWIHRTVFQSTGDTGETLARTRAIHISTITVVSCLFEGNTGERGGAISTLWSTITLNNNVFIGNRANNGGAILVRNSTLTMNGNIFEGNRAELDGGAISVEQSTVYVNGVHIAQAILEITITCYLDEDLLLLKILHSLQALLILQGTKHKDTMVERSMLLLDVTY